MKTRNALLSLLLIIVLQTPFAYAQEPSLQGFDEYVNKAMKEWDVPGVAIALIKNDKIILAKGYGVKKLGDAAPVTERTVFAIGSSSKAFTAALVAMLVDDNKMKWDDPLAKYLSGFQLFDNYASREISLRDSLSHRSGLERGDLLWYGSDYSRDEILRRVRHLKPSWSFRSRFGYQNIMYLAAGEAVAAASKKSWDDNIKERLFKPLGMTSSSASIKDLAAMDNVASPHDKLDNKVQPVPWRNIDNIAPAGSINSTVVDMAQWVRLHLNEGKYNNQTLITSGSIKEMHTPQTVIRLEGVMEKLNPDSHFMNYGLGWFLQDYKGRKVVQHGGNIDGMSAMVGMIPEEKIGVVILTNMNGTLLRDALLYAVFDYMLPAQGTKRDWSADMLKAYKGLLEIAEKAEKKKEEDRVKDTKPSLALKNYIGTYTNEMYGDLKVSDENGKLVVNYNPAFIGELEHWNYDTFRVAWRARLVGKSLVTFTLNAAGKVDEIKVENFGDFKRAPDKAPEVVATAMSESDMMKYVGKYEVKQPPLDISIEMIGGKLKAVIPGQPVGTLVPIAQDRFKVSFAEAPVEIYVQFEMAGDKPKTATIEQGGMKFTMLPKP